MKTLFLCSLEILKDKLSDRSWRTSFFGTVGGTALAFVLFAPEHFKDWPIVLSLARFAAAGGLIGLGIESFDKRNAV